MTRRPTLTEEEFKKAIFETAKMDLRNYIQRYFDITVRYFQFRAREMRTHGVEIQYETKLEFGDCDMTLMIKAKLTPETIKNYGQYLHTLAKRRLSEHQRLKTDLKLGDVPPEHGGGYHPIAEPLVKEEELEEEETSQGR